MPDKQPIMAVVNSSWVLPIDEAVALLRILAGAQAVDSDWSAPTGACRYKLAPTRMECSLVMLSPAHFAELHLKGVEKP